MREIVVGNRRFTMQVRFPQEQLGSVDEISNLRVGDNEGHFIQLADIQEEEGSAQISREGGQRRISVEVVIGVLVTSTLLTLLVLPALYKWLEQQNESSRI